MRLEKYLAECGVASRHGAQAVIESGLVEINGRIVTSVNLPVDPRKDDIRYRGIRCRPAAKVYIALNKPANYISSSSDNLGRRTVYSLLPPNTNKSVAPVGRLDRDAEGLMLFTNDGELANTMTHPRFRVPKTYHLECLGCVEDPQVKQLLNGIWLAEGKVTPRRVYVAKRMRNKTIMQLTVCDGKKNEIKRIMKKIGHKVISLKRLSIGPVNLGNLQRGRYRYLDKSEIEGLKSLKAPDKMNPTRRVNR